MPAIGWETTQNPLLGQVCRLRIPPAPKISSFSNPKNLAMETKTPRRAFGLRYEEAADQRRSGDQAGSEASEGVMIRLSLKPVISTR